MLREIVLKSFRYSLSRTGMHYIIIFSITSYIYLCMYRSVLVFIVMLFLSILMVVASILSDRRDVIQFISVFHLVGARRKILFMTITIFILPRFFSISIAYSIAMISSPSMLPLIFSIHIIAALILSLIIVKGIML